MEAGSVSDCVQCPVDTYTHLPGQERCFFCGGEAVQPNVGSTSCSCIGNGRQFQVGIVTCNYDFPVDGSVFKKHS